MPNLIKIEPLFLSLALRRHFIKQLIWVQGPQNGFPTKNSKLKFFQDHNKLLSSTFDIGEIVYGLLNEG